MAGGITFSFFFLLFFFFWVGVKVSERTVLSSSVLPFRARRGKGSGDAVDESSSSAAASSTMVTLFFFFSFFSSPCFLPSFEKLKLLSIPSSFRPYSSGRRECDTSSTSTGPMVASSMPSSFRRNSSMRFLECDISSTSTGPEPGMRTSMSSFSFLFSFGSSVEAGGGSKRKRSVVQSVGQEGCGTEVQRSAAR